MKITLHRWFGQGVFFAPWQDALMSVLLAVCVFVANEIYAVLNHGPAVLHLQTPLDEALPVVPIFVIPYVSLNLIVYVTLVFFLVFRNKVFQSACLAMILAWLVSYGFYLFLQSEMIRPALAGEDMFTRMIRDVYASDHPFNCFPSLHTSMSTILAIHWFRVDRRIAIGLEPNARAWLARRGYDPIYGARPLARVIQAEVRDPLTDEILFGRLEHGGTVRIGVLDDRLAFSFA